MLVNYYKVFIFITSVEKNDIVFKDKTITDIMVYNNHQCSGLINLEENTIRNTEGEWRFNNFRDIVIDVNSPVINNDGTINTNNLDFSKLWFEKSNFIGKFIVVRLYMNNMEDNTILIHDVKAQSILANR